MRSDTHPFYLTVMRNALQRGDKIRKCAAGNPVEPKNNSTIVRRNIKIHLVDTWGDAARACNIIKTKRVLGLDMELVTGGQITAIVQVAVSTGEAYVFDVLALGQPIFDACYLLPILVDHRIIKLCYDCRGDADTLFRNHGVRAYGLYDLQIVFTSLFQSRADPCLKGLRRAAQAMLPADRGFIVGKTSMKRRFSAEDAAFKARAGGDATDDKCIMSARPLSDETLLYCAEDTIMLMRMHEAWGGSVSAEQVVYTTAARATRHIFRRAQSAMHLIDFPRLAVGV